MDIFFFPFIKYMQIVPLAVTKWVIYKNNQMF